MIIKLHNQARDYAWGSKTLIPDYFGVAETGRPMAEVWFGTHLGSPTMVEGSDTKSLADLLGKNLSFLLKILAAETPLSIQAHPSVAQAREGFERENALGIPLSASNRNYKDANHKPEMIVALTDFEALCGFRPKTQVHNLLLDMVEAPEVSESFVAISRGWLDEFEQGGLRSLTAAILGFGADGRDLMGFNSELSGLADFSARFELAARLNELYPGDPGVVIALLMNHVVLAPGEALYLPAGNIHAYLAGLGVEIMANSDNVLRGGLTPKHIDVAELARVLNFEAEPVPLVKPKELARGLISYETAADDFELYRATLSSANLLAEINLAKPSVLLCTAGVVSVTNSLGERLELARGEAAYMSEDARHFSLAGSGELFIAAGRFTD
jgi:mannose-6-phosphate isomerase